MRMRVLIWILTTHLIVITSASSEAAPNSSWRDSWNGSETTRDSSWIGDLSRRIKRASIDLWLHPLGKYFEGQSGFTAIRVKRDSNASSEAAPDSSWSDSWNDLSRRNKRAVIDLWLQPLDKYFKDQFGFQEIRAKRDSNVSSEAAPDSSWSDLSRRIKRAIITSSEAATVSSWIGDLSRRIKRASIDLWLQPLDKYFEDQSGFTGFRVKRDSNASSETASISSWSDYLSHRIRRVSNDLWLQPLDKYFQEQSGFTGIRVERDSNVSSEAASDSSRSDSWKDWSGRIKRAVIASSEKFSGSFWSLSRRIKRASINLWLHPLGKYFENQSGFTGIRASSEAASDSSWSDSWRDWSGRIKRAVIASSEKFSGSFWSLSRRIKRASQDIWFQTLDKYFEDQFEFMGFRVERDLNGDAFSTLQSRISTLARVVTGVSLYNGLVEGTIPVDETIGELMNIGSISFDKLEKFNKQQVNSYVKKLQQVSTELEDLSKSIEEALLDMAKMKEMWNDVGDLNEIPNKVKFDELKVMENLDLSIVEKFDVTAAIKKVNGKTDFPALIKSLEKIAEQSKKAKEEMDKKNVLKTLAEMTPFYKYVELTKYYKIEKFGTLGDNKAAAWKFFKEDIGKLLKLKDGDSSKFTTLKALTKSQSAGNRIDRKFSSGFVNGFVDLKQLPMDLKNPWILNRFGWLELEDGLKVISNLGQNMAGLNDKWKLLKTDEILRAVEKAATMETKLEEAIDVTKTYETVLDQFTTAQGFQFPFIDQDILKIRITISRAATQLLRKGKAIEKIFDMTEKRHDAITKLDASSQPSMDDFVMLIEALHPYIQILQSGRLLKELSADLHKTPEAYTDLNTVDTKQKAFYGVLKATSKDFDDVAAVADLAVQFRELKSDKTFGKNIEEASKVASESFALIQSIRTAMGNIKTSATDKAKMLPQLKGLQTFSKPLGDSVAVIDKMQKILNKKNELISFVTNGHVVDSMTDTITDSAIEETVRKTWVGFEEISQECMSLFGEVKKRKDGVAKPNDDQLESYGPIIEALGGLNDVDLYGNDKMIAIDALLPISDSTQKAQLNDLRNSLKELLPLDMTFARHSSSLPGMTGVLTGITGVFTSVGPKPTVKPVPVAAQTASPRSGNQVGGQQMSSSTVQTVTEKDNTIKEVIIGCGCAIVGFLFGGGAHHWYKHNQEKKQQRLARKRKIDKTIDDGNYSRPATTSKPFSIYTRKKRLNAASSKRANPNKTPIFTGKEPPILPAFKAPIAPKSNSTQKAIKERKKKRPRRQSSTVAIDPTQESEVVEYRSCRKKMKTEYFEDQNDDDTLGCVKEIENEDED